MKPLLRNGIVSSIIGWLIWLYMALCSRTISWRIEGEAAAMATWKAHSGIIIASWHANILLLPSGWNQVIRHWPGQRHRSAMLISLSREGEAVAKAIRHLGLVAVRGSSNHKRKNRDKGGMRALAEAVKLLREGGALCITPDGPRGPAQRVQDGPTILALRTGAPLIPYAILSQPAKRLNTWDRFIIPYPFTKGAIVFGPAIVPDAASDKDGLRLALEEAMRVATQKAETLLQSSKTMGEA